MTNKSPLFALLCLVALRSFAQFPSPAIVGYWENWIGANYTPLKNVDDRYNVIHVSFASHKGNKDYDLQFVPPVTYTEAKFKSEMAGLQAKGKKVFISIGGQNDPTILDSEHEKDVFVSSVNAIVDHWGFDGIDIDLEGNSMHFSNINIANPTDSAQIRLIDAIKEILANHQATHGTRLLMTMAPETIYVQGALSEWSSQYRGAYLPIIEALRDDIDMLNVQLYNSGNMFGIDGPAGGEFSQSTPDFIVALTEAVIRGFTGVHGIGTYSGLPASKVGVGLPGCQGWGYTTPANVQAAINYLRGDGPKPGSYTLKQAGGYPDLGGMMTWSINSDKGCNPSYGYVKTYQILFAEEPFVEVVQDNRIFIGDEDGETITVNIYQDIFANNLDEANWSLSLPEGVSIGSITRIDDGTASITLSGSSDPQVYYVDIDTLKISIAPSEFASHSDTIQGGTDILLETPPISIPARFESDAFIASKGIVVGQTTDTTGFNSLHVENFNYGDYLDFEIEVPTSGNYVFSTRAATQSSGLNFSVKIGSNKLTDVIIPHTGGFGVNNWTTVHDDIYLDAGVHVIRVLSVFGGFHANWFEISPTTSTKEELEAERGAFFHPNPIHESFIINEQVEGNLTIMNTQGTPVKQSVHVEGNSKIDMSDVSNGVYLLRLLKSNGDRVYGRLVKE